MAAFASVLVAFVIAASVWLWMQRAPLGMITGGGSGPPTIVLLHGYGSNANDWSQFEPHWQFPGDPKRVYLQAPLRGPISGGRGWWWLHLERYVPADGGLPDLSTSSPGGITVAANLVCEALQNVKRPLILGGFSQGAMVSAEIAFQRTDQDLDALILLSGTTVKAARWAEHFAARRRMPIFIAHGRRDPVLSFDIMDRFQQRLKAFGMDVTWYPFDGGHEIPPDVIAQVNAFVQRVLQLESPAGRP